MTTSNKSCINIPIYLLLFGKASRQIRLRYHFNTHAITVLFGCWLFSQYNKPLFTLSDIQAIVSYYSYKRTRFYLDRLLENRLIVVSDNSSRHNKYMVTELGISTVQDISVNLDKLIYDFCNKYNIEL